MISVWDSSWTGVLFTLLILCFHIAFATDWWTSCCSLFLPHDSSPLVCIEAACSLERPPPPSPQWIWSPLWCCLLYQGLTDLVSPLVPSGSLNIVSTSAKPCMSFPPCVSWGAEEQRVGSGLTWDFYAGVLASWIHLWHQMAPSLWSQSFSYIMIMPFLLYCM